MRVTPQNVIPPANQFGRMQLVPFGRQSMFTSKISVWGRRAPLVPVCGTISPIGANLSTTIPTCMCGLRVCRMVRPNGGDCPTNGDEWRTPGLGSIKSLNGTISQPLGEYESSQSCATPPHLLDNLTHWGEPFDNYSNLHVWFTRLSNGSPQWWRLSNKWGGVAHD